MWKIDKLKKSEKNFKKSVDIWERKWYTIKAADERAWQTSFAKRSRVIEN